MPSASPPRILIVGAGLAGSLLAVLLARRGFRVSLYERRPDPRTAGYIGGRSINLALSARGIAALAAADLADRVLAADALPMRGRIMHSLDGTLAYQPYSANPDDAINSVSRGGLNLTLLHAAAALPNVDLHFDHCCTDIDLHAPRPAAIFARVTAGGLPAPNAQTLRADADLLLAADGAFSPVRLALQRTDRFDYSQTYLGHGYKELHIPPSPASDFALDPAALHIWPRKSAMMIALPNRDRSFTCTLFWPLTGGDGDHAFSSLRSAADVRDFFSRHYPDAVPLMPSLERDFLANPTSSLLTVRCFPWQHSGKVALLGDAAHAIVPFYGQGMNCAFEDCSTLLDCLSRHGADPARNTLGDTSAALDEFQRLRKPQSDAIADMALDNFTEMRDKVGSPDFLYRKKVEQALHRLFPDLAEPQYHLVSFSTVPYADAQRRGRLLDALYDRLIAALPADSLSAIGDAAWSARLRELAAPWFAAHRAGHPAPSAADPAILDITPPLSPDLDVWPGDTPLTREVLCDLARGDSVTLSTLRATVHLGAHADGPNHYDPAGRSIDRQPLDRYLGPCHVIDTRARRASRLTPADLLFDLASLRHPRVLLRTATFPDPQRWNADFAALSVELVDALAARGVFTIGIDTPSVDLQDSKDLPAHRAIARHDIAILEGLDLARVTPGDYELIAAPLPLADFDASPVRALLRPLT